MLRRVIRRYRLMKSLKNAVGEEVSIDTGRGVITGKLVKVSKKRPLKLSLRNAAINGDS